jgi:hypothetical protein
MSRELLAHVFSSLSGLEKTVEDVKVMSAMPHRGSRGFAHDLNEQERVIHQMRRAANRLQLHYAHNDMLSAVRELHIYYGLNAMVRPSVMRMYAELANIKNPYAEVESQITCH